MTPSEPNQILVVVTLDCERPTSETDARASGPPTYEQGAAWTQQYVSIAAEYGLPVTLFVHPEVASNDADILLEFRNQGNVLGLHLHPWRFADGKYAGELGALSPSQTRDALSEAVGVWHDAIGFRPRLFRAGACSMNDSSHRILSELGFDGGSTSLPGRCYPDVFAIWAGSEMDPYRAHESFKGVKGSLDYVEMPISVDTSRLVTKSGRSFHWDLRPDFPTEPKVLAKRIVEQVQAREPAVPVINMVTHNDQDFSGSAGDRLRQVFEGMLEACESHGATPAPATVRDVTDLVLAEPVSLVTVNKASGKAVFEGDDAFVETIVDQNG